MPKEHEFEQILNRIHATMIYSCQELALLVDGVQVGLTVRDKDEISSRMRNLAKVLERICADFSNPAPSDLPDARTELHAVGVD